MNALIGFLLVIQIISIIGLGFTTFLFPDVSSAWQIKYGTFEANGNVVSLGFAALLVVTFVVSLGALPFVRTRKISNSNSGGNQDPSAFENLDKMKNLSVHSLVRRLEIIADEMHDCSFNDFAALVGEMDGTIFNIRAELRKLEISPAIPELSELGYKEFGPDNADELIRIIHHAAARYKQILESNDIPVPGNLTQRVPVRWHTEEFHIELPVLRFTFSSRNILSTWLSFIILASFISLLSWGAAVILR